MADEYPGRHVEFVRAFTEGRLRHPAPPSDVARVGRLRGIDIFRLDPDGKVGEHWDVLQVIPEASANDNGIF